ncbi:hypothetical protein QN277_016323 [Acacia crassicarpa]|uniref:Epidermal patterning factor-like protein n=1 Tax=Acacia crassicarpa TaxID=499986 RepID=A0AAE1MWG1_9FABA|nr:hypothetical protein QN277_016323 [Acacia crassicarpa]
MERKRNKAHLRFGVFFFFIFLNFTIFSSATTSQDSKKCPMLADVDFQKKFEEKIREISLSRRVLGGLGSSPPRCSAKCGKCTPCRAVHVPVPPGTPVTSEYYPEAWRCKCGNKLYMP